MKKTINIYINGTNETSKIPAEGWTSLANILHTMTVTDQNNSSICLDGCAINNQIPIDLGAIFTFNLYKQVDTLIKIIRRHVRSGDEVVVNAYGFSRGGAAVFLLCKKLKDISPQKLKINVVSFEPVPGNFIIGVYADLLSGIQSTMSADIHDLSDCKNLNSVYVLFTNQPLPDIACHGPILPIMPKSCHYDVDVIPGCHRGSELFDIQPGKRVKPVNKESAIAFVQVVNFLVKNGVQFNPNRFKLDDQLLITDKVKMLKFFSEAKESLSRRPFWVNGKAVLDQSNRAMHMGNMISTNPNGVYVNRFHKKLAAENKAQADAKHCVLNVINERPQKFSLTTQALLMLPQALFFMYAVNRFTARCYDEESFTPNKLDVMSWLLAARQLYKAVPRLFSCVTDNGLFESKEARFIPGLHLVQANKVQSPS